MTFDFAPDFSKADLDALLASEAFEYQRMPLPFGQFTKGQDRSATAALIYPESLAGESLLDVGCCYGYFGYEAKRRGAGRVMGVELDRDRFRQAAKLQRVYRDQIELRNADFLEVLAGESFDHVLLLNVIHHLKEPAGALRALARSVRKRCVIEFPTFADKRFAKSLPPLLPRLLNRLPLTGVALLESMDQTYVFSTEGIRRILMEHDRLFARVRFVASPMQGRMIAICEK